MPEVSTTPVACDGTTIGAIRYNTGTSSFEGCNGAAWSNSIGGGGVTLNAILAATAGSTINNLNWAQEWDWQTLSTGNGLTLGSKGLSSGSILFLSSSGTAAATGQKGLNIALGGTNGTGGQTTYGAYIANTHAGATSTNVGLYATATGGTTANYAAIFPAGNVGIGTATPTSPLQIVLDGTVTTPPANWTGEGIFFKQEAGQNLGNLTGLSVYLSNDWQVATTTTLYGIRIGTDLEKMTSITTGVGLQLDAPYSAGGTITNYYSIRGGGIDEDNGTITNNYGMLLNGAETDNYGAITNNYGIYLGRPCTGVYCWGSTHSSIANNYGLYLDDMSTSASGATNTYSIYSNGGQSYFKGNVGIGVGTTTPATKLDVSGTVRVADGGETCVAGVKGGIRYTSVNTLQYCNSTAWQTVATSSGGTAWNAIANPTGNLALTMGANTSLFTYNATTGVNDLFKLTDTASNTGTGYLMNITTATGSAASPLHLRANTSGDLVFTSAGRLGIGTSTPQDLLSVQGTSGNLLNLYNGGTSIFKVSSAGVVNGGPANFTDSASGGYPATVLSVSNSGGASIGGGVTMTFQGGSGLNTLGNIKMLYEQASTAYSAMTFETSANYVKSEVMRLTSGGNVGIGTPTPTAGLHVATAGVASTPGERLDGAWYIAGTATTSKPQLLIEPSGTTTTGWNPVGTGLGVNAASGFAGNLLDLQLNGASKAKLDYTGALTVVSCTGCGGGARLDQISAANTGATIDSLLNPIVWNWSTLATGTTALTLADTNTAASTATTLAVNSATTGAGFGITATMSGASGAGTGVWASNASVTTGAVGVYGKSTNATATATYGVRGDNTGSSNTGAGVLGTNVTTGANYGVEGTNASVTAGAAGVYGVESGASNTGYGVYGNNASATGWAVYGVGRNYFSGNTGVGAGATAPGELLFVSGGNLVATGTDGSGSVIAESGAGTRMMWYPKKAAFRAGQVPGTQWDDANIGDSSAAFGLSNTASGNYSAAFGAANTASGNYSTALGYYTTASGTYSTALGAFVTAGNGAPGAVGSYSLAIGLTSTNTATYPEVTGTGSLMIAMQDQHNVNMTANNAMALLGGSMIINPATGSGAGMVSTPSTALDVRGSIMMGNGAETCASGNFAGAIRYSGGAVQFCNGTSWANIAGGSGTPGGSNTQVQFNSGGAFGASANFVWLNATNKLGVGASPTASLDVQSAVTAASAVAYGLRQQQTLTAAANNDALYGLYLNTTFADATKTGVTHTDIGFNGTGAAPAPRLIAVDRNATAATAGFGLTLNAGGAVSGGTNLAGGDVTINGGVGTGSGTSNIIFTASPGTQGTATVDNTLTQVLKITGKGTTILAAGTDACAAGVAGGIRYTSVNTLQYCNSASWQTLAASGGNATLNGIAAATASNTPINNAAWTIGWNWNSLAAGNALTLGSSSLTSGNILFVSSSNAAAVTGAAISAGNATTGAGFGVKAAVSGTSNAGYAVYGLNSGATNAGYGGYFENTNGGAALGAKGPLRLLGTSSGYVGLAPAPTAGTTTYTLPAADGLAGYVLGTNGSATLSWVSNGVTNPANAGWLAATVPTSETTSVATYGNLTTVGPAVTIITPTTALVTLTANMLNGTQQTGCKMGFAISGATTRAASDAQAFQEINSAGNTYQNSATFYVIGLNAGTNTFTAQYAGNVSGKICTIANRNIVVTNPVPLQCSSATPTAFSFSNVANAAVSTLTTSNIVQVSGFTCALVTTISGPGAPAYRICSDSACSTVLQDWTSATNSIASGQYLQLRQTSSASGGMTYNATIIAGTTASVWGVATTGSCGSSPAVGTLCADGSIYAGLSPSASQPMYVTHCDAGMTWDGTACNGTRFTLNWNNGTSNWIDEGYENSVAGMANTTGLAARADAASPHYAVQSCKNLNEDGHTDWYLPALSELNVMYSGKGAIGNFDTTGSYYWSSTEAGGYNAQEERFDTGVQANDQKSYLRALRCARAACSSITPNAFSFTPQTNVALSTLTTSNIVQLSGFDCAANTSISGAGAPAYRTCSDSACSSVVQNWTTGAGSVTSGQYVQTRMTSSATAGTVSTATLSAGNTSAVLSVTTGANCSGSPAVGTLCPDGSVYAGVSSGRGEPMFVTRCDAGMTWNGTACTGGRFIPNWNNGSTNWIDEGRESTSDGYTNTVVTAALTDAASPHYAAQQCKNLNEDGHTDWYLPAIAEMDVLYSGKAAIANFDTTGSWYWSSTENGWANADHMRFSDDLHDSPGKNGSSYVRCARVTCNDTTPAAFSFIDQGGVALSTQITSNIVQISGFDCTASTSISGAGSPAYRICSDSACAAVVQNWTTGAATVASGQYVQARLTSSASGATINSATLTAGGTNTTWNVETVVDCTTGTPPAGTVCADGSVYAGVSPGRSEPMFVTRCDAGMTWNGSVCTGARMGITWNNGTTTYIDEGRENPTDGYSNSAVLAARTDADSPHYAAQQCKNLNEDGHTDWYLPAINEIAVLYPVSAAIGGFNTTGNYYISSTETNNSTYWSEGFNNGYQASYTGKTNIDKYIRCARVTCNDTTPEDFSFTNQAGVALSTLTTSNIVQLFGFDCAASTSISGAGSPAYRICSDPACSSVVQNWTTGAATVAVGQFVQLRLTSSASAGTINSATLTAGGTNTTWNVTTVVDCTTVTPPVGSVCADGSVYAGVSPNVGANMFTERCDQGQTWNGTACAGTRLFLNWNNGTTNWIDEGYENSSAGMANTTGLAAKADAASPHYAAQSCKNLNLDGHTDWYLPALSELGVLYSGKAAIGNFDSVNGYFYWSSTEAGNQNALFQRISDGYQSYTAKNGSTVLRCVRAACNYNTPTAFSFTAQTGVAVSTLTTSNIVLLTGFDCTISTSISGAGSPAYRICSDSACSTVVQNWTTGAATAVSGQYAQTRLTSSATAGTLETATLTAGGSNAAFNVTTAADCTGSPAVGTMCADGSLYAGISPDGSVPMYATRCDAGRTWSGTACTGTRFLLSWNNGNTTGYTTTGMTSPNTGKSNTATLVTLDSNSGVGGTQPHQAAQTCVGLNEDGHTDWYLPSLNELSVLYAGAGAIGDFDTSGNWYWSSTENGNTDAWMEQLSGGSMQTYAKQSLNRIRCARHN